MRGDLVDPDTGAVAGITATTWQSETPRGVREAPIIRAAYMVDADWLYVEWDPMLDTELYTIFAATKAGPYERKVEAGATDRGPFRYTYFRRSEICAAAPSGQHELWVQIWPGDDSSRAVSADVAGTITCP